MILRYKALQKAKQVYKTKEFYRWYNHNGKKTLDVVGVLAECMGIKVPVRSRSIPLDKIAEAYKVTVNSLFDIWHDNDDTDKSLTVLLRELFDKNPIVVEQIDLKICNEASYTLSSLFPTGNIPLTMESAKIIAGIKPTTENLDLGFNIYKIYNKIDKKFCRSKKISPEFVYELMLLNYGVMFK